VAVAIVAFGLTLLPLPDLATDLFMWLGLVNIALALFNLVPAFPLDGGRLLASFFWWRSGTRRRGVHTAVRIGRVFAYGMIAFGLFQLLTGEVINGVWVAFIGWFLLSAGTSEETGSAMRALLRNVPVSAAMSSPVVTVPDWLSIDQFLESVAPQHRFTTYPVHDPAGKLTGMVRLSDLVSMSTAHRSEQRLKDRARPIESIPTTRPDEELAALIERIGTGLEQRVLVFDQAGGLVGILSPADIARILTVRQSLGQSPAAPTRP
jgi:predicted transcriptional regulator